MPKLITFIATAVPFLLLFSLEVVEAVEQTLLVFCSESAIGSLTLYAHGKSSFRHDCVVVG